MKKLYLLLPAIAFAKAGRIAPEIHFSRTIILILAWGAAGMFFPRLALAQDPVFSQFYAMPLQINPGFAGTALAPRAGLAYRNQWTGFQSAYRTYAAYYEQSFDRLNSGMGFNLEGDNAGNGIYKTNRFSAVYSYRLKVNDQIALKLGLEMGVHQVNLNWDKLLFPDQLDPINGISYNTEEIRPDVTSRADLDISSGLLLLSQKFYLGVGLKHLNTPSQSILRLNNNLVPGLPIRYTFHGGTDWVVKKGNKRQESSFVSPNFLFVAQGPYKQLNVGAYASLGSVFAGSWFRHTFRNSDAIILLAGFKEGPFKIGISYDATVSKLASNVGGTFELTLGLVFENKKRPDINDCTRMFQ
ncbi:MAG: PorP/SprF family type IX secretion system membrane protein [Saprospiraceae bacterium]